MKLTIPMVLAPVIMSSDSIPLDSESTNIELVIDPAYREKTQFDPMGESNHNVSRVRSHSSHIGSTSLSKKSVTNFFDNIWEAICPCSCYTADAISESCPGSQSSLGSLIYGKTASGRELKIEIDNETEVSSDQVLIMQIKSDAEAVSQSFNEIVDVAKRYDLDLEAIKTCISLLAVDPAVRAELSRDDSMLALGLEESLDNAKKFMTALVTMKNIFRLAIRLNSTNPFPAYNKAIDSVFKSDGDSESKSPLRISQKDFQKIDRSQISMLLKEIKEPLSIFLEQLVTLEERLDTLKNNEHSRFKLLFETIA